jgi:small subunit ribosomal protein S8
MSMTDPIADMLTRVRNANTAMHDTVKMPSSKMKESLAKILVREGYVAGYNIKLNDGRPISGIQRVSKPGLRVYRQADQLPRVLGGMGVAVLSTSHGLLTDREARYRHVGGEIVCFVW